MSPAAQGASLTEGKKSKRGKNKDGRSGSPKSNEGSDNEGNGTNGKTNVSFYINIFISSSDDYNDLIRLLFIYDKLETILSLKRNNFQGFFLGFRALMTTMIGRLMLVLKRLKLGWKI